MEEKISQSDFTTAVFWVYRILYISASGQQPGCKEPCLQQKDCSVTMGENDSLIQLILNQKILIRNVTYKYKVYINVAQKMISYAHLLYKIKCSFTTAD